LVGAPRARQQRRAVEVPSLRPATLRPATLAPKLRAAFGAPGAGQVVESTAARRDQVPHVGHEGVPRWAGEQLRRRSPARRLPGRVAQIGRAVYQEDLLGEEDCYDRVVHLSSRAGEGTCPPGGRQHHRCRDGRTEQPPLSDLRRVPRDDRLQRRPGASAESRAERRPDRCVRGGGRPPFLHGQRPAPEHEQGQQSGEDGQGRDAAAHPGPRGDVLRRWGRQRTTRGPVAPPPLSSDRPRRQ